MRMMFSIVFIAALSLQVAYASPAPEVMNKPSMASPHGAASTGATAAPGGMAATIKGATLPGYQRVKIGEAFEKYRHFKQKSWRETRGAAGTMYVDFSASAPPRWLDFKAKREGISSSGIEVKFAIYPNGEFGVVMVSRTVVKTDGTTSRYPMADVKSVLDAIYSNKKLDL